MKFSLSWLKLFLNKNIKNNLICHQLTQIGLEVEDFKKKKYNYRNSIVGEISLIKKLNDSNLFYIKINKNKNIKIFSKNKNFYIGMKLAVGLCKNLNIKIDFKNKKINNFPWKIFTYSDFGMFGNKNFIVEFPKNVKIGSFVKKYFKKNEEDCISINVTPNRNDCLGILGIARDLSVINNTSCNFPSYLKKKNDINIFYKKLDISFDKYDICSDYYFKVIENIDFSICTPFFIKEILRKSHINSVDIVTDVVNYVSLELGQSIHVFDFDKIDNNSLQIRRSKNNEKFFFQKKKFINLSDDILVILNNKKIISLGGFIQSDFVKINSNTKKIFLGSGVFKYKYIDRIKNKYKQYYNSYDNYFRKCNKNLCILSINRISSILKKICGGVVTYVNYFKNKNFIKKNKIILSYKKINKVLGFKISKFIIKNILKKLNYFVLEKLLKLEVIPPDYRIDILCVEDVISDIVRFYGYDNIPSIPLNLNHIIKNENIILKKLYKIKNFLLHKKYCEVINYSFTDISSQKLFINKSKLLRIKNPISKDLSYMRASLFPGLIKNLIYNKNRQQDSFSIFESGLCFYKNLSSKLKFEQVLILSGIKSGIKYYKNWYNNENKFNFYDIKYDVECLLSIFLDVKNIFFKKSEILGFEKNSCIKIFYGNFFIGYIGILEDSVKNFFKIYDDIFCFKIFIESFPCYLENKINEFYLYPYSTRDLSIIVSKNISAIEIIFECYKVSLKKIFKVFVFDVYQGKNIPNNKKSLSIRIFFQDLKKCLTNNEIDILYNRCIKNLKNKFKVFLRNE
ncbi:MAG: phenylalanine--tRNA ligase subunit beta [Buchnera aphidicola (Periphyllus acericola)]|uniref:phenylalanine--tRNA ligase subunit beta n=1 Tax=Buchnera aphidicola TaxID=9 RepID=UPI0030CF7B16|nr:phenylalanine--tRNA ligase subunit beta [Buchnera aphidicola (Periphyllus acericola)]